MKGWQKQKIILVIIDDITETETHIRIIDEQYKKIKDLNDEINEELIIAESIQRSLIPELNYENEYLKKAINFSNDLNTLQNVKDYLIKNRDKFVIFNSKNLAEELSEAFKKMIKDYKNA